MKRLAIICVFPVLFFGCNNPKKKDAGSEKDPIGLRHSTEWIRTRLLSMLAVDDAYLWHDVLGGRAIHQNSITYPPTEPLEGNFVPGQQSFFALNKMHIYELYGSKNEKLLDDSKVLLDWVVNNAFDKRHKYFYFKYNWESEEFQKNFNPEFSMFSVAALYRYNSFRPDERYREIAGEAFETIINTTWDKEKTGFMTRFVPDPKTGELVSTGDKYLYTMGYLAINMIDVYGSTGEKKYLDWSKKSVDFCNKYLWDDEYGGWYMSISKDLKPVEFFEKYTHINADMVQANYELYLLGMGDEYLRFAEDGLAFIISHLRKRDGLWAKHCTRNGSTFNIEFGRGDAGGSETAYDRQMQVVRALALGSVATGNKKYPDYIDDTLDEMEKTMARKYPAGINYIYIPDTTANNRNENTWCHMWGLKGFIALLQLQNSFNKTNTTKK